MLLSRWHIDPNPDAVSLTEDREAEQPLSNALAKHPLVLLDQQLKRLADEDNHAIEGQPRARP